jgi:putative endonuclease
MKRSGVRLPSAPPVFARCAAPSEDCRAVAQRRRGHTSIRFSELRLGKPFMSFHYVYILQSEKETKRFYIGSCEDLHARLKKHNAGEVPYTSKFRPWKIKTAVAFVDRERAFDFERYLKTSSGRAFAKKRL